MKTQYNVDLDVADRTEDIPREIYSLSAACFKQIGLVGERHVDEVGRVHLGFDPSCSRIIEARFDIHYREDRTESFRELLERWKYTISGFDKEGMEALDHFETLLSILERADPLSCLPINIYFSLPNLQCGEINTPAGIQSLHAHFEDGDFIRFIKPRKERCFWDYYLLKDYLFDKVMEQELPDNRAQTFLERLAMRRRSRKTKKYSSLYQALSMNPDSVDRIRV